MVVDSYYFVGANSKKFAINSTCDSKKKIYNLSIASSQWINSRSSPFNDLTRINGRGFYVAILAVLLLPKQRTNGRNLHPDISINPAVAKDHRSNFQQDPPLGFNRLLVGMP